MEPPSTALTALCEKWLPEDGLKALEQFQGLYGMDARQRDYWPSSPLFDCFKIAAIVERAGFLRWNPPRSQWEADKLAAREFEMTPQAFRATFKRLRLKTHKWVQIV